MVFYQLIQYGRLRGTHHDIYYKTEEELKQVCNRIVAKAKKLVAKGDMLNGAFDVTICKENGEEIDCFVSGTDYEY